MNKLLTYNPKGTGDEYGIQFHGENLKTFFKALSYVLNDKGMKFPLPSHHGIDFNFKKFNLKLTIYIDGWTHINKGNGIFNLRFLLRDENWYSTINKHGVSERKQGLLMSEDVKYGFVKLLNETGFVGERVNAGGGGITVMTKDSFKVVATIIPPSENALEYKGDIVNEEYFQVFNDFIGELQTIFEHYEIFNR